MSDIWRFIPFLGPYKKKIVLLLILSIFSTFVSLSYPIFGKIFIDEVLIGKNPKLLPLLIVCLMGFGLLGLSSGGINRYLYANITANILFSMRLALYQHLQRLPLRFYTHTKLGEILSRINSDLMEVQSAFIDSLLGFVTHILILLGTITILIYLNWRLFLISFLLLSLGPFCLRYFKPKIASFAERLRDKNADIGSFLVETLSGIKFIKAWGAEGLEAKRFIQKNQEFIHLLLNFQILSSFYGAISGILFFLIILVVFLYGGHMVVNGYMSVGSLIAFGTYQMRAIGPLQGLMGLYLNLLKARVSLKRVMEIFDLKSETEIIEGKKRLKSDAIRGVVEFRDIYFSYNSGEMLLKGLNFTLEPGGVYAIVGLSGAGKTTVADLLLRFYDPIHGDILIDGYDIKDMELSFLRSLITLVLQETFLFHTSLAENICYADTNASIDKIITASKAAGLHPFVETLPSGYNTIVGERGIRLSAGQRQQVAIARALLRSPKILILDEAMASMDLITESLIKRELKDLIKDCTTIIITHRLSSLQDVDKIFVISDGRVVQEGNHEELLRREGPYNDLNSRYIGSLPQKFPWYTNT